MPPERAKRRAASQKLLALLALAACASPLDAAPAGAQSLRPGVAPPDATAPAGSQNGSGAETSGGGDLPGAPGLGESLGKSLETSLDLTPGARRGAGAAPLAPLAANYGRPRPKTRLPKRYPPQRASAPPPFSPQNPLPPLEPYRSSPQARQALRLRPGADAPAGYPPPPTVAAAPTLKTKPKARVEDRPYDPVGFGVGSLRLTPSLEASYGHDDNPNRLSSGVKGSSLLRTDGALTVRSDWDRHEFQADLRLGYSDYFDLQDASRPDGTGTFKARYDVTKDTALDLQGRFSLDTQRPGSPNVASGAQNVTVTNRPIILSYGDSAGVTQKFNHLQLSLRGGYDRTDYEDAHYSDGTSLRLSTTNYTALYGTGRAEYEIGPTVTPFVEATLDKRVHDSDIDVFGYKRDNHGMALRGGARVKVSDLLRAEASGGYAERSYSDSRLPKLRGPTIDAEILYTPTPLTTVTLRGSTTLAETTTTGASGILIRTVSAQVSHDLLRNLTIAGTGSYSFSDYQGSDIKERSYAAGVQLEYKLTRSLSIKGSYSHEHLHSTTQGADYTANVFLIGLKLQH